MCRGTQKFEKHWYTIQLNIGLKVRVTNPLLRENYNIQIPSSTKSETRAFTRAAVSSPTTGNNLTTSQTSLVIVQNGDSCFICCKKWDDFGVMVRKTENLSLKIQWKVNLPSWHAPKYGAAFKQISRAHKPRAKVCSNLVQLKWSRYKLGVVQRVGRGIALLFHDRGTRRRWVVSSTPRPHFPPRKTRYTFYRRLGGPQGRSGRVENLVPTGNRSRTVQPVAQSLYRLSYQEFSSIALVIQ